MITLTPEQAQELINKWYALDKQVNHDDWAGLESQPIIAEMLPILSELKEAGYTMSDDGLWFHLSEAN
jgi:hypothetical protein